jgi:predicted transcriptional regulator
LHSLFYYLLSHIIKTEITIILPALSLQVGGRLLTENRNEFDVVAEILWVVIPGSKESEIMTRCSLDRGLLEKYVPTLMILKLVSVERKSENFYQITGRGLEFLRFYHGLRWLLWGKNFDSLLVNILARLEMVRKPSYIK